MYRDSVITPPGTSFALSVVAGLSVVAAIDTEWDRQDRCCCKGDDLKAVGATNASLWGGRGGRVERTSNPYSSKFSVGKVHVV